MLAQHSISYSAVHILSYSQLQRATDFPFSYFGGLNYENKSIKDKSIDISFFTI